MGLILAKAQMLSALPGQVLMVIASMVALIGYLKILNEEALPKNYTLQDLLRRNQI